MERPSARLRMASIAALAACLIVAAAAPARALIVIPDRGVFNIEVPGSGGAIKGSIDFVGMVTGVPAGGVVLAGSTAATDVTFVFAITLDADAIPDSLFSTTVGREPSGAASPTFSAVGTIPGPGSDIANAFVGVNAATWSYDPLVPLGTTADTFFLSFSSVDVGDQFKFEEVILPLGTFTVFSDALEVAIDVPLGSINLGSHGVIPVFLLTTPSFDATTVDPATVCFGDAEDPAQHDCTDAHGRGHSQDVDRDGDLDLVLHFEARETGIDAGDTEACLEGEATGGVFVEGCDAIVVNP